MSRREDTVLDHDNCLPIEPKNEPFLDPFYVDFRSWNEELLDPNLDPFYSWRRRYYLVTDTHEIDDWHTSIMCGWLLSKQ